MAGSILSGGRPPAAPPVRPAPTDAVTWARRQLARQVTGLLTGDPEPRNRHRRRDAVGKDSGYFGPDSVTWRVHADTAMLVGGVRALMLQTLHPLAMAGVDQHSNYRADPLVRLANTARYLGTAVYGTRAEAERAVAAVRRVHEPIVGVADDGRPYTANDPHLLTWVHHTLVDSFLVAYQRYGSGRLTAAESDRYVEEQAVLADLFRAEPAARSVAELRRWFAAERPELRATPGARRAIRFLLAPPLPVLARGPYGVLASASVTLLPGWARRSLRLPVLPGAEPFVVRPAATAVVRAVSWVLDGHPDEAD